MRFPQPIPEERVPMDLTPQQVAKIKNTTKKVMQDLSSLTWFLERAEEGESEGLTRETARNVMSVTESKLADLGRLLGVDTEAAQRIEERHADIRRANLRIQELEGLLAQQMPPEALRPALYAMGEKLKGWWDLEGFGNVRDMNFGTHSLKVEFSCQFLGVKPKVAGCEGLPHAERKALWLADLQRRGFVLLDDDGKGLSDCPATREALRALFAERLPGAKIAQFISREGDKGSKLVSIEVYIYKLPQILALPAATDDADEIDVDA